MRGELLQSSPWLRLNGGKIVNLRLARAASLAAPLGAGLLLGLVGPTADKWDCAAGVVVSAIFSAGWTWACYAFLVGYFRQSKIEAALLSSIGLAVGVVAYYLLKDSSSAAPDGLQPSALGGGSIGSIQVWGTLAFVFGAPVGFLGNVARIRGIGGLFYRLLIPLVAFYETSMRLDNESRGQGMPVIATWNAVRFIAVAVAFALVGQTIWSWWHARRVAASRSGELECPRARAASRDVEFPE